MSLINGRLLTSKLLKLNGNHMYQLLIHRNANRKVSQDNSSSPTSMQTKELRFPLPYGHLAAKEWGSPGGLPVLAVHGWLDNCGSFDPLIPHILEPNNLHVIAIDEPGVGLSSHKPPGSEYGRWSTVMEMKRVIDYMQWPKCTLMGHSQGGHFSLLFAAIYPQLVDRVISIDIVKPIAYHGEKWYNKAPKIIEMHSKFQETYSDDPSTNPKIPVYTESEAIKRMMNAHKNSLTEESAKVMMIRGTKKFKDGLIFSRDIRLRIPSIDPPPTDEQMIKFMTNIRCDLLVIRAKQGPYHPPDELRLKYYEVYERNCPMFKDVLMDGSHHLHMNNPEQVGAVINEFITESLRSQTKPNL